MPLISSDDQMTSENWYTVAANKIDELSLADSGLKLLARDVDALVSAMAAYAPATAANVTGIRQATVPPTVQTAIKAAWRA